MTVTLLPLPVTWQPYRRPFLSEEVCIRIEQRIQQELDSWLRTPYIAGNAVKGVGVDCIRYMASFLNAMYRKVREQLDRLPPDTAMHNAAKARSALRQIIRIYSPCIRVEDGTIEPGDVLIVSPSPTGGPSHAKIVSAVKNKLYEATTGGVSFTGIVEPADRPWAVYRVLDKELWA